MLLTYSQAWQMKDKVKSKFTVFRNITKNFCLGFVTFFDRHLALLRSVPEIFGS